ncbi:mediator of DNA damage checkpoint protein 1-like isoform X2 [Haliotis rufescens]|uniref:mediator of DNA damage checkpoint protein 1-like isoform X2 n=1 Tax=Haliotis rufescens TaxID=6454 RepID=UPI00201F055C|nr:mediator of DNA damage checkpoint protein 1-like isoform X2 [Haliotis rufescens]
MDFDQTQVIALDEFEDDTDENISQSQKSPVAHLKVGCQKGVPEKLYPLYEGNNIVGRQEDCNVYIPSKALSKQHACVEIQGDSHLIYDSGSRNKTRRGRRFLTPNVRYELNHNDALVFADIQASYLISSDVPRVEDSGSETGSESMLQTVEASDSANVNPVLDKTAEDDMSDASSDILQPTQPSTTGPSWTSGRMLEPTQLGVTDSPGDLTIGETPLPKKNQSADLSTLVLPESDTEDDSDGSKVNPQATLMFEEEKDTSGDQDLLGAPTQAFMVTTDTDGEDEDDPADTKNLMCAATQACGFVESDPEEDPKVDLFAPTLAVVQDSESDTDGSCVMIDLNAPTQAVLLDNDDDDEEEEEGDQGVKTMAYEMDIEKERQTKGKKSGKTKASGRVCAPTQAYDMDTGGEAKKPTKARVTDATVAYDMDTDGESKRATKSGRVSDPTVAYDLDGELKEAKTDDKGGSGSTQSFIVQEQKSVEAEEPDDAGLVPTQVFEGEEEEEEMDEDVSHLLMTSTLACDMEEDSEDSEDLPEGLEGDGGKDAMQPAGDEDATQAFEEEEVTSKKKGQKKTSDKNQNDDATQVFGDDATVAISDPSPKQKKSNKKDDDATQVFGDETQVFSDDATLAISEPSPKHKKSKKQPDNDDTQGFSDDATLAISEPSPKQKKSKKQPDNDATQVFSDDATLAISEPSPKQKKSKKQPDNDATQVFSDDATLAISEPSPKQKKSKKQPDNDATQVFSDDATQVFEEDAAQEASNLASRAPRGRKSEQAKKDATPQEDATQVFEEADVAVSDIEDKTGDGATQVFDVEDATLCVSGSAKGDTDADATQAFDCATLMVEEEDKSTDDSTQVFGDATVAIEEEEVMPARKRGRGKKSADDSLKVKESDATVAIEEEEVMPARKRGRGKKVADDSLKVKESDATVAIEEEEVMPARKRGRGKKAADDSLKVKESDATVAIDEEEVMPARKRGRGKKSADDSLKVKESDATVAIEEEEVMPARKRGLGKKSADDSLKVKESDATVAIEEEEVMPARKRGLGKKAQASVDQEAPTVPADVDDATVAVSEPEPARQGRGRRPAKGKKPSVEVEAMEEGSHSGRGRGVKRGRRSKDLAPDVEDATMAVDDVCEGATLPAADLEDATMAVCSVGQDATLPAADVVGAPDSAAGDDSDSEGSTLPVEEVVNMAEVEDQGTGMSVGRKNTQKPSPVASSPRSRGRQSTKTPSSGEGTDGSDLEPTQVYGADEPEATQQYGLDSTEEMVPDSHSHEKVPSPMIPLPERSPRKSAMASPRRSPSPSPKRVAFAAGVADNENKTKKSAGMARSRGRGRRSLDLALADVAADGGAGGRRRSTPGRVAVLERLETGQGRGRGRRRGVGEQVVVKEEPVTEGEGVAAGVEKKEQTVKRGRKEVVVEEKEEETVKKGRGRKGVVVEEKEEETVKKGRGRKGVVVEEKEEETVKKGRGRKGVLIEEKEEETVKKGRGRKEVVVEEKEEETAKKGRGRKGVVVEDKETQGAVGGRRRSGGEVPAAPGGRRSKGKTSHTAAAEGGQTNDVIKEEPESLETEEKSSEEISIGKKVAPSKGRGRKTSQDVKEDPVKEEKGESDVTAGTRRGRAKTTLEPPAPDAGKRGTSGRKSLPAALVSQVEPKPTRRGRSTEKCETVSVSRRARTPSEDSVKSSLESVDESKPTRRAGRAPHGKTQTEGVESTFKTGSQTKHAAIDESDPNISGYSDIGRGRRSESRQSREITVSKGKGKTLSKTAGKGLIEAEESQTKPDDSEPRTSVRKRTSEESLDLPAAKRGRKGGKGRLDSPGSGVPELLPSTRKRGRDSSAAEEVSGSKSEDSANETVVTIEEPETEVSSAKKGKKGKTKRTLSANRGKNSADAVEDTAGRNQSKAIAVEGGETSRPSRGSKASPVAAAPDSGVKRRKGGRVDSSQEQEAAPAKKSRSSDSSPPPGKQKQVTEEMSSPSLRRKSMDPKPRVLFTGVVDEQGQKIVKDLGGGLATSIHDCTHLVTDKVRRTVKFLGGVARGVPIVTPHWLNSSKSAGTFLDCSKFLVSDTAAEKQYKFSLKKSLARAAEENLLGAYKIHVSKSVRPEPPQMKDVLMCAGAEYLSTMPKKVEANMLVMSCEEDKSQCQAAIKAGIPIVSAEFILTGILRQEVDVDSFRLFSSEVGGARRGPRSDVGGARGGARSKSRK